jgi:putative transcriptional regulator
MKINEFGFGRFRRYKVEDEIIFNIDVMLAKRKMSVTELAEKVGITIANMSVLKNGKAKALKISTLAKLCAALDCQPGDILEYRKAEHSEEK